MKKIAFLFSAAAAVACSELVPESGNEIFYSDEGGKITITIDREASPTKAMPDYTETTSDEEIINNVAVFVFDKATGTLNASCELETLDEGCTMTVTAGEKIVYAVVNGPDLSHVTKVSELERTEDDLSATDISTNGLVMVGREDCIVAAGQTATPVVTVKRLVARVVLLAVKCSLPSQYKSMRVNSVYLGDANSIQSFGGTVSGKVNVDGYEDAEKTRPIGQNDVLGACSGYMFRTATKLIDVGNTDWTRRHLYCQPSDDESVTCMYMIVTIDGTPYYYRVPLVNGLKSNSTYSVEVEIANIGSLLPPDTDMQKGEISATVEVAGWDVGDKYEVEF